MKADQGLNILRLTGLNILCLMFYVVFQDDTISRFNLLSFLMFGIRKNLTRILKEIT
jgi:hypothetical protein